MEYATRTGRRGQRDYVAQRQADGGIRGRTHRRRHRLDRAADPRRRRNQSALEESAAQGVVAPGIVRTASLVGASPLRSTKFAGLPTRSHWPLSTAVSIDEPG